jgi:hypothetical protein
MIEYWDVALSVRAPLFVRSGYGKIVRKPVVELTETVVTGLVADPPDAKPGSWV